MPQLFGGAGRGTALQAGQDVLWVQSLAGMPDVVERLATNIQWTTDLGNAFLDQQEDILAAVQRMRAKAAKRTKKGGR